MSKELNDNELNNVAGGMLEWKDGKVYSVTEDTAQYQLLLTQGECVNYIIQHCFGMTDQQTLDALAKAGYLQIVPKEEN